MVNHYQVLKLHGTATQEDIRTAYKTLVLKYHPDKVSQDKKEDSTTMFALVSEAFKTLSDPSLRAAYDNSLGVRPPPLPTTTTTTSTALTPYRPSSPSQSPSSSNSLFAPTPIRPQSPSFSNSMTRQPTPPPGARPSSPHFNRPYRNSTPVSLPISRRSTPTPTPTTSGYLNQATYGGSGSGSQGMVRRPSMENMGYGGGGGGGMVPFPTMSSPGMTRNPVDLFESMINGGGGGGFGGGGGYGGGGGSYQQAERDLLLEQEEEELQRKLSMRPDLEAQVNAMLGFGGTSFGGADLGGGFGGGFGGGGGGGGRGGYKNNSKDPWSSHPKMFGKDPWGTHFDGEIRPNVTLDGMRNRGRSMSTSFMDGEKHRNGDYRIRQQKHDVEELNDGTIRFSSSNVEVRYASGKPRHSQSSHSKALSQAHQYNNNNDQNHHPRPSSRSSSHNRSSSHYPYQPDPNSSYQNQQPPSYPSIEYSQNQQPRIQYPNSGQGQISYSELYQQSKSKKSSTSSDLVRKSSWGGGGGVSENWGAMTRLPAGGGETGLMRRNSLSGGGWRS